MSWKQTAPLENRPRSRPVIGDKPVAADVLRAYVPIRNSPEDGQGPLMWNTLTRSLRIDLGSASPHSSYPIAMDRQAVRTSPVGNGRIQWRIR